MSKLTLDGNENYAAEIATVRDLIVLDGLDNLRALPVGAFQALVSKDTPLGEKVVVIPAGAQVSEKFAHDLNLHRHTDRNADPSVETGYLEDNRRVRAIRLRGHRSDALVVSAAALGVDGPDGTLFTHIDGEELVRKYIVRAPAPTRTEKAIKRAFKRVDDKFLPEHLDTANWFRNQDLIGPDTWAVATQKVHGTSIRLSNTIVRRRLRWWERLAKRLGVRVAETELDYVFGSRKVIKDPHNPNQNHYYATDLWTEYGQTVEHLIPANVVIYGELVGWVDEATPIQPNYTYALPPGDKELYVYRVATVTQDGGLYDLPWEGVKAFCAARGFKHVPEIWQGYHRHFEPWQYMDTILRERFPQAVPLSPESPCDEGVCVRAEGIVPTVLKAKSPQFLWNESLLLDKEVIDIESA